MPGSDPSRPPPSPGQPPNPGAGLPRPGRHEPGPALALWLILAIVAAMALTNWLQGRWLICDCGTVQLWAGKGHPDGTSQHIADWYAPSHFLHGLAFFFFAWLLVPRWPFHWRLALAVAVEAAWEVAENMPFIIDRYRQVTVSKDYNGDTVLNSVADVGFMIAGFWLASRISWKLSLALFAGFELLTLLIIRDGLMLNILMLLWPVPAIASWQAGA